MMKYNTIYEDEISVGMKDHFEKKVTESDVENFAKVTGDFNPMHMDEEFAKETQFGGRIAHGMISAGMISAAIGNKLPGPGSIYLGQTLRFDRPVKFNDVLSVSVEVIKIDEKPNFKIATIRTNVYNQKGELVTEGEATVMPAKR